MMMGDVDSLDLFPDLQDLQTLVSKNSSVNRDLDGESTDSNEVDLLDFTDDEDLVSYLSAPSQTLAVESDADRESRQKGRNGLRERTNRNRRVIKEDTSKSSSGRNMKRFQKAKSENNTKSEKVIMPVVYKVVNSSTLSGQNISVSNTAENEAENMQQQSDDRSTHKLHPRQYGSLSMSKNAVAARENRLKKKQHFEGLEKKVETLSTHNNNLKETVSKQEEVIRSLISEVEYLKRVLANQSTLSALLKNIQQTPGVNFNVGNSFNRKRTHTELSTSSDKENNGNASKDNIVERNEPTNKVARLDHDYFIPSTEDAIGDCSEEDTLQTSMVEEYTTKETPSGGICLHVSGKSVSLEFCASCSTKATGSTGADYNFTLRNDGTA